MIEHVFLCLFSDNWQLSVPSWEKKFCTSIGLVPWRKLLETKKCMYLYDNVVQWNDSAGEEAFHNAKSRFWAEINGLPCDISLPDPDIYIDEVDWNSMIDAELLLDLEREPEVLTDGDKDEKVLILGDSIPLNQSVPCTGWGDKDEKVVIPGDSILLNQSVPCTGWGDKDENVVIPVDSLPLNQSVPCTGWGDAEEDLKTSTDLPWHPGYGYCDHNVDNANSWEQSQCQSHLAMEDNGRGNDQNQWKNGCNEWENNYNVSNNVGSGNGYWGMWDDNSRKKEGSDQYMSRYKTSRFHGNEYQMAHGWRNGRGRRVNVAYE